MRILQTWISWRAVGEMANLLSGGPETGLAPSGCELVVKMDLKSAKKRTIVVMRFPCCKHCPPPNECDKKEGHQVACHYSDPKWNDSCRGGRQVQHRVKVYV